jgi:hypothetical protein
VCNFGGSCGGCGGVNQACCALPNSLPNLCVASGTACVGNALPGTCGSCGAANAPCCAGGTCNNGGCCVEGQCRRNGVFCAIDLCAAGSCGNGACGSVGQPCCVINNQPSCTGGWARCEAGSCVPCGGAKEGCCDDPVSKLPIVCQQPFVPSALNASCTCN